MAMTSARQITANFIRGGLIGTAEVIPGVSGGTIALVVGLYDRIVRSASSFFRAIGSLLLGRFQDSKSHISKVEFGMLLPLGLGMILALLVGAAVLEPLLEDEPEIMRGLFAGMILASLLVPFRLAGKWSIAHFALAGAGSILAFALTSIEKAEPTTPSSAWVFFAAALAICALVLPGVSGSFLLLALGMYQPTIAAVNDRDLGYLGIFLLGAIAGLASFALLLQWLLSRYHSLTMATMTGLMLGSLRALWPWQTESGGLQAPGDALMPVLALLAGGLAVLSLIAIESRIKAKAQ